MIKIIDYGLGNVHAFLNIYKSLGISSSIVNNKDQLLDATHIILPGVGAFDQAVKMLEKSGLKKCIEDLVMKKNIPILGVCIGMQLLANISEEGKLKGLGFIDGNVKKLCNDKSVFLPHMGWNEVIPKKKHKLFNYLEDNPIYYFLHSYYFECAKQSSILASSEYSISFSSVINVNNVYGVQFHPEKSHHNGMQLLKNFADL